METKEEQPGEKCSWEPAPAPSIHSPAKVKETIKACWAQGDYTKVAKGLQEAARILIDAADVRPGATVLDVAAGDGNSAIWAARAGATVTATDLSPKMVDLGKARSASEGLDIKWIEADMEYLPFDDDGFDHVVSSFGVMCATNASLAVAELFRVARPGGKVAIVNWAPYGWARRLRLALYKYLPPPPGAPDHMDWGRKTFLRPLLNKHASSIQMRREILWMNYPSPSAWWGEFSRNTPALVAARKALSPESYEALQAELVEWVASASVSNNGSARFPSYYLVAIAEKDG